MLRPETICGLSGAMIATTLMIVGANHVSQRFGEPDRAQLHGLLPIAPVVNRDGKADRTPVRLPLPKIRPILRTKLPLGCDPAVSPLTGMQSESNRATYCIS